MNNYETHVLNMYKIDRLNAVKKFHIGELKHLDLSKVELDAENGVLELRVDYFYRQHYDLLWKVMELWCKHHGIKYILDEGSGFLITVK